MKLIPYKKSDSKFLIEFLTSQDWPYHKEEKVTSSTLKRKIDSGYFASKDTKTFWIVDGEKIGFIRVFDIEPDGYPLFDIRIKNDCRGKGVGTRAIKLLVNLLFTRYPRLKRIEATTRADNVAMQKVFKKSGFVKESQYRYPGNKSDPKPFDTYGYSVLRKDWENHTITKVVWKS